MSKKIINYDRVKNESPDNQLRPLSSMTLPEATNGLKLQLWNTSLACEKLCQKVRDLSDEHEALKQEQHDHITNLQEELKWLRQTNNSLQADISQQRANYSLLVGDIGRVCDEKQRIIEQCSSEQFQKELNGFILHQFRDESAEQKKVIDEKNVELRRLGGVVARLEAELRNQCCYYERCIAGGEKERSELRRLLCHERYVAWQSRLAAVSANTPRASRRGRKRGFRGSSRPISMP
ncbi:hypothetical protein F5Y13DRAFT_153423 [Hypoxylon sp. FL1857]|nr:hypothetical protein F5Y13DRAFT_153423 [Hypoxylon sp. FL1857]